jgi:ubiquinone/menaquinone biosynthesis C-methylase UbiE
MSGSKNIDRYMQSCRTEFWQGVFRIELESILQDLVKGEEVLSVGCGPAIIESALSERGFSITGLDVSQEALDCAPDSVRTVVGRAEEMPFPESSFGAAIYVASLQFIEDYRKALEQTARVLRPEGRLIVLLLNPESDFFKRKLRDPNSYVRKIKHTELKGIEEVIAEHFNVHSEYLLGVKGDAIFESRDLTDAVLYIIRGTRKQIKKDKDV